MASNPSHRRRPGVHSARVVYCENPAFLARLQEFASSRGLTVSEVQRQATRRMLEAVQ